MPIPNLQVALDHSDVSSAVETAVIVGNEIDIIEVGTVLLLEIGSEVIKTLRHIFPDKIIIADTKCADAGGTVAKNVANRGATWMTCMCNATLATMQSATKEIEEVQVELYGNWTYEEAQTWLNAGIRQVIYHQSRDALLAGETWGEKDLTKVNKLIEMGFKVSVTGGLNVDTLPLFKGMDIYTFIVGRGITETDNPIEAVRALKNKINEVWRD
ncbi:3-keto-L-gulonate-6-phosphate decarboxylase UlaD [Amphibacillus cookii]|uniref:3-keto-L-gulonate-6-phosphate decarboxylase UlaD n=1 Tax=Amphibacillus cookii TaxID=767787 RepID=UPI001958F53A|nr:3-keto-L-gulonate-6-phosphate decarboxylase UlaD [Amphibacillus cookii]MBM7541635.1 3-dehydro-L-gulonate-6-phosphate decarboxylase [Amphibacillus cookii]